MTATSWKTTSAGILAIVGGITRLAFAVKHGDITEEAIVTAATAILTGLGLMFARDNNVTSEDVAARKAEREAAAKNGGGFSLFVWTLFALLALTLLCLTACATRWIDKISQTRIATTKGVYRTVAEYNAWLQPRTNNPAVFHTTYDALMADWTNVDYTARTFGQSALLLELLEDSYRATPTNESALVNVASTMAAHSSNLTLIVKGIVK